MDFLSHACAYDHPDSTASFIATQLDLVAYAREHRYRLRNLHDGGPVPPAIWKPPKGYKPVYTGAEDRFDAIVGYDGYVAMDGDELSVCLFYRSTKGVNRAITRLKAMGGRMDQEGDTEVGATVPVSQIEEVLRLIKVSKLQPGDASRFRSHTDAVLGAESHGQRRVDE